MEIPTFDKGLVTKEAIEAHLTDIQFKYIACHTNINSINIMLGAIKADIEEWNGDTKSLEIALDEQNNQLASNIWAIGIHTDNIEFLKSNLD